MSVHYKFKSNLDHDTVTFDGLSISVADLKKSIMQQKKIGKSSDFDLQITNAQTKEVYDSDEMLIPKNTSVIVARVPVASGNKKNWDKPDLPLPVDDDDLGQIRYDRIVKSADLVNANTTEEDKVKAMITQSSQEYDPSKYVKSRSMTGPLPPTYTCFRCGKQGHWIKNCPTNNPDVKRSTGIPRSFMVPVDGPEHKGALLTSSGDYAVPLIDHQAYKEVKKEKPPFVPQEEPPAEPEAQIPEELLCMVCKDLLQDAVLIPCCGNSFCDECVRQVLLESDNHECPVCHEVGVSPNTLIPNRFLRTAVLNFKNETGYTRIKRMMVVKSPVVPTERVDSPQPSPDSTVENQLQASDDGGVVQSEEVLNTTEEKDIKEFEVDVSVKTENILEEARNATESVSSPKSNIDETELVQPGTPLADEPPLVEESSEALPVLTSVQEKSSIDRYEYKTGHKYYHSEYDGYSETSSLEPKPISTIETITNTRKAKNVRLAPLRPQFLSQRNLDERPDSYDRENYCGRFERNERRHVERNLPKSLHHSRYDRSPRSNRYRYHDQDYSQGDHKHDDSHYEPHLHPQDAAHRHPDRYRTPSHPLPMAPSVQSSVYIVPSVPPVPQPLLTAPPPVYAPQPPPPGASPVDTSHIAAQPPPPGVGPLLPPTVSSDPSSFKIHSYETEDPLKESSKVDERSIDDQMVAFQRKLEKRDREYGSRSRSRSSDRERSRSSSRSRSYESSKSWTRSPSRSSTRTSRSRSRSPFSSRSRSRSYSHSRSRSWSKTRSYTRSRSCTRTESSRSRSRSRTESRLRRRGSGDRIRSPRLRNRSPSFSPRDYRSSHRSLPYADKHSYTPPQFDTSYQAQYGPPPAVLPMPVMRPTFPPHHIHSLHPATAPPIHTRPIEHYPVERQPKYPPPYSEPYPMYDVYPPKYPHQRYDRDQRLIRYEKRQDYYRQQDGMGHRIPGWIGDRSREYKPRYRQAREAIRSKEIKELPKVSEADLKIVHTKEYIEEVPSKKKEEKNMKHKRHHHKIKDVRKQEKQDNKVSVAAAEKQLKETGRNLIKVEVCEKENENKISNESLPKEKKVSEKSKEKKHKHKKHKSDEVTAKKKKTSKKDKCDQAVNIKPDFPVKIKKKKGKVKSVDSEHLGDEQNIVKDKEIKSPPGIEPTQEKENVVSEEYPEEVNANVPVDLSADTLDIFADEAERESVLLSSEITTVVDADKFSKDDTENDEGEEPDNVNETLRNEEKDDDKDVLHVDVPALSKWEREDLDEEFVSKPQRKSTVIVPKDDKASLSSDIIQRAELVLLSKPFKPRIENKEKKGDSVDSSTASSPDVSSVKHKEVPELKSVVNSEKLASPTLQVTISTHKERRSVHSRKDDKGLKDKSQNQLPKKIKHDIAKENRKITIHSKGEEKSKHEKRHSSQRDDKNKSVHDRRDRRVESRFEATSFRGKDERKCRLVEHENHSRHSSDYVDSRVPCRSDKRSQVYSQRQHSYSRKYVDKDDSRQSEKLLKSVYHRRSRSRSCASSESSYRRKARQHSPAMHPSERSDRDYIQSEKSIRSQRRKHSPIKPPEKHEGDRIKSKDRDFNDDLKFEPDYDEYSDTEAMLADKKEKVKKKSVSPELSKKRIKLEAGEPASKVVIKTDKSSITSSSSSTPLSESDSTDSEDQKGLKKNYDADHKSKHKKSRHKKHKKHKHKHKKKKSHKSK